MKSAEIDRTIRLLEQGWKNTCGILDQQEKAFVETYLGFLRAVARACLERRWRVWFSRTGLCIGARGDLATYLFSSPGAEKPTHGPTSQIHKKTFQ